jgi:hypothetical protein
VSQRLEVTHAIEAQHRRVMTAATFHRVVAVGELLVEVMRTELDSPLTRPGDLVGPFPVGRPSARRTVSSPVLTR